MTCDLIETPLGNGKSRYTCPRCDRVDELSSGLAHANRMCGGEKRPQPGSELAMLLKEIGVEMTGECKCFRRAQAMDANGLTWVKDNPQIVLAWIKEAASESSWSTVLTAGSKLLTKPWFSLLAPWQSILAEAIRRSESSPIMPDL